MEENFRKFVTITDGDDVSELGAGLSQVAESACSHTDRQTSVHNRNSKFPDKIKRHRVEARLKLSDD